MKLAMLLTLLCSALVIDTSMAEGKIRVLIIDGMNNHDWPRNTRILKAILEKSDRFTVDVSTSPRLTQPTDAWDNWRPKFSDYACVGVDFNGGYKPETGVHWPRELEKSFEDYVT